MPTHRTPRHLASLALALLLSLLAASAFAEGAEDAPRAEQEEELGAAAVILELEGLRQQREELQQVVTGATVAGRAADALYDRAAAALGRGSAQLQRAMARREDPATIDALAREVRALNELRIALLERTTEEKRDSLLGFGREGLTQLVRELQHLRLVAKWYPLARLRQVEQLPALLHDVIVVGSAGWTLVRVLFVTLVALWVHRRHRRWLASLRAWILEGQLHRGPRLIAARAINHLAGLGSELIVLAWLLLLRDLAGAEIPEELHLVGTIAIAWAWYRLARALLYRVIASAAVRTANAGEEQRRRVLRSLELVGRYALAVTILLLFSETLLGRGYLHAMLTDLAWIGAVPVGIVLVRGWQDEIASSWIETHPEGSLTRWLERTRGSARGVIPAMVAAGSVVVRGCAHWVRETALRFDQTRSALAYLFRRRLERHADTVGHGLSEVDALPRELREAFTEEPVSEGPLAVDHWPRLDEVLQLATRVAEGQTGGTVALVGERGAGKTSWLGALALRAEGIALTRHTFERRITSPAELLATLAAVLGIEAEDEEALVQALREGEPRLVLLDGCEHLVLRAVGGLDAADTLLRVAGRTARRVLWVCAFGRIAFAHLRNLHAGSALFREVVQLGPWSEAELARVIEKRMEAARCSVVWDDLLVERLDGVTLETEVLRTSERYRRLLRDYAGGIPRVALHFWLRSLVPDGKGRMRVRLFESPPGEALDRIDDAALFLLAAVALHGTLTAGEAALALREPPIDCEIRLAALESEGWLASQNGRYAPTTHWYSEVLRLLRRKHVISG